MHSSSAMNYNNVSSMIESWTRLRPVYASAFMSSFGYFFLAFIIPILMYPSMTSSTTDVALVLSMMTAGMALFSPLAGRASQRLPLSTIFYGSVMRAVSNLVMSMAVLWASLPGLGLGSLLWGVGGAFYVVGIEAVVSEQVARDRRAEAFGRLQSVYSIGSMIGGIIAFFILLVLVEDLITGASYVFIFLAATNVIGGSLIYLNRAAHSRHHVMEHSPRMVQRLRSPAHVLILAFATSTFIVALVTPFVELYVIATVSNDVGLVAMTYLPGAVLGAVLGPRLGRVYDRGSKTRLLVAACIVGSVSVLLFVAVPHMASTITSILSTVFATDTIYVALILIAVLFTTSAVATTVVSIILLSVMGTAYEGVAGHGIGIYEASLSIARVAGPIAGGIMWDLSSPSTPMLFAGLIGLSVIPVYYRGILDYTSSSQRDVSGSDCVYTEL